MQFLLGYVIGFFIAGLLFYPGRTKKVERYPKVGRLKVNGNGVLKTKL